MNMQGKTVLITGGNSGLGLATAGQLATRGATVVITARDSAKCEQAKQAISAQYGCDVDAMALELASFNSIRQFATTFQERYDALHVLINNAGLNLSERRETEQGFEYVLGVNHVGHFLLTRLLLDQLKRSSPARIINLASAAHVGARKGMEWDDLQRTKKYGGQAYCQVKLGVIYVSRLMARQLSADGISVFAVNPGLVSTGFAMDGDTHGIQKWFFRLGKYWMKKPDDGAATTVWAASSDEALAHSGCYLDNCAPRKPSSFALDDAAAQRFWDLSEQWISNGHP